MTDDGDHKIRDESVDVDKSVGVDMDVVFERQERDVTPASCPTSRASNVTENFWVLTRQMSRHHKYCPEKEYLSRSLVRFYRQYMSLQ